MDIPEKLAALGTQVTRQKDKQKKPNIICVGHHYAQTSFFEEIVTDITTWNT